MADFKMGSELKRRDVALIGLINGGERVRLSPDVALTVLVITIMVET